MGIRLLLDYIAAGRLRTMLTFAAAGLTGVAATSATAAPQPYACYYNPSSPCYTATGYGGSIQDINPVEFVAGLGGAGSIAYANNDHGGTVSVHTQGNFVDEYGYVQVYRATAQLKHFITVASLPGANDPLVGLHIKAFATQLNTAGLGSASYTADQPGLRLVGRSLLASFTDPDVLFDIDQIVYVRPDVPIEINLLASASGNMTITVDPIYEIVGQYASRYKLTGLLTSAAAVPEPATWAMMILGFGAIGLAMRRRLASQPASLGSSLNSSVAT